MNYPKPFRYLAVLQALILVCSCVPASEESDNPPVQLYEPPFDVDISAAVLPQDATLAVVLTGEVHGAPPCTSCEPGYFTLLPFGEPSAATVGLQYGDQRIEALPHPLLFPDRENHYRFSYVDKNGYTNSAVARYRPQLVDDAVTVYSHPANENDSHLVFTVVFHQDLFKPDDISIRYPGNGFSPGGISLGNTNFTGSYLASSVDSQGRREFDFKIELEEGDEEAEGIEYAAVEVTFSDESESKTIRFSGAILDDDSENVAVKSAHPPPMSFEQDEGVCPLAQSDRLGSSGDLRFSLEWDNPHSDLNLWVKDPCDNVSSHLSAGSQCGQYGVYRESTEGMERPSENIVWPAGAETGEYAFAVEQFSGISTEFTLCVYHDGIVEGYRGVAEGGAVSEIVALQVGDGDIDDFSPVASSKTETPDFDYGGEVAELFSVKNFSVEPVTVVQSVEDGSLRAELQFAFDVVNLSSECQGRYLDVSMIGEEGNRTSALVIGNNTYKEVLAEERGDLAYLALSDWIEPRAGEILSPNLNIDIPLLEHSQTLGIEFVFSATDSPEEYASCQNSPSHAPEIPTTVKTIHVPAIDDITLASGGVKVGFAYPYIRRPEGAGRGRIFREDVMYLQYETLPSTEKPGSIELHINRELYRDGLALPEYRPVVAEVDGDFIMDGVDFDYKQYRSPIEFRYIYRREFIVESNGYDQTGEYRLALSGRADVIAAFDGHSTDARRNTLFYYADWDVFSGGAYFDGTTGHDRPTVIYFSDYPYVNDIGGSGANDIYHIGDDTGDASGGGPVRIGYSEDAVKGHDVLSFSSQVDLESIDYYRMDGHLVLFNEERLEQEVETRFPNASGDIGMAISRMVESGSYGGFLVFIENYFDIETDNRLVDEFRWNNNPYITHEEILEKVIEL